MILSTTFPSSSDVLPSLCLSLFSGSHLPVVYVRLLVDEEAEVRAAAVSNLTMIGKVYKSSDTNPEMFAENVIPVLTEIAEDPCTSCAAAKKCSCETSHPVSFR